ncbi:DUF4283 domain protein, partial [Trifolium medium]|nr:DUF4283 domain protein [Trifolium medium]
KGEDGEGGLVTKEKNVMEETTGKTVTDGSSDGNTPNNPNTKLVRMYRSNVDDLQWARKGVVATVINGEAVPLVQQRIEDAGFADLVIIPLG